LGIGAGARHADLAREEELEGRVGLGISGDDGGFYVTLTTRRLSALFSRLENPWSIYGPCRARGRGRCVEDHGSLGRLLDHEPPDGRLEHLQHTFNTPSTQIDVR